MLTLEKLQITAAVGVLVTDGNDIVSHRKIFDADAYFVIIDSFSFNIEDISNDVVDGEFGLPGDWLFECNIQILNSRVRIELGDLDWLGISTKRAFLPCLRYCGGAQEAQKNQKKGANVFQC